MQALLPHLPFVQGGRCPAPVPAADIRHTSLSRVGLCNWHSCKGGGKGTVLKPRGTVTISHQGQVHCCQTRSDSATGRKGARVGQPREGLCSCRHSPLLQLQVPPSFSPQLFPHVAPLCGPPHLLSYLLSSPSHPQESLRDINHSTSAVLCVLKPLYFPPCPSPFCHCHCLF